jgi:hypothetical protein
MDFNGGNCIDFTELEADISFHTTLPASSFSEQKNALSSMSEL